MPKQKEIPDAEKTQEDWDALPDVVVLNVDIVNAVICAKDGLSRDEIAAVVNREHPTGISSSWSISDEPFEDMPNPMPCPDGRTGAKHYLLTC